MKRNVLLLTFLLLCLKPFCQVNPSIFYFDKDLNISTKSKAVYTGEGKWEDSLFRLELYENKNHYHIFSAHYTDTTLAVMDGRFISYYNNGNIENFSYYNKGKPEGLWIKWNADKKVVDSVWYNNGATDSSVTYNYSYPNRKLTSTIRNNFIDSSIIRTRYDEHERPLTHDLSDSIRVGDDKVVENPDEEVAFPGSDSTMNNYFQYWFNQHKFELISMGTSGACNVRFKVDKNGQVTQAMLLFCDNRVFARIMEDAIGQIAWLPATKDNKPVTAMKEVSEEFYPSLNGMMVNNERRYYFDQNFNATEPDDAKYYGKITREDNSIKFTVHHYQHSNKVFSIHFTDSSLETTNGEFESFYYDNQKLIRGNFLLGRKNGAWLQWDAAGQVVDSAIYNIGAKTSETFINYQPEGGPEAKTTFDYANGKKRTVYYSNRKVTSDVIIPLYGKEEGDTNNIFTNPEVTPSFQEGPDAWDEYINEYVNKNMGNSNRDGVCVVRFIVNTDGKISGAEALTLKGSSLAKTIINGVMSAPDWVPATQDGKKVKAYVILPIRHYFVKLSAPTENKRYIHPLIINSVKLVNPIYNQ